MPELSYQLQTIEQLRVDSLTDYYQLFAAFLKLAPDGFNLEDALAAASEDDLLEPIRNQQIFTDFVAITEPGTDEAPVALLRKTEVDLPSGKISRQQRSVWTGWCLITRRSTNWKRCWRINWSPSARCSPIPM